MIGSLFTGYGGLDLAVEEHLGTGTAWTSDIDPGACKIIAHRMPHAPNLGDITAIDWATVEPVDILTGGFPCQDLSHAGKRLGLKPGTRSGLWSHMAYAISQLRPQYVIAENVRGLLSASADSSVEPCPWCVGGSGDGEPDLRALGAVLGDLAGLGYDAQWVGLRAADIGAPHGRFRVFVVATDTQHDGWNGPAITGGAGAGEGTRWLRQPEGSSDSDPVTDTDDGRRREPDTGLGCVPVTDPAGGAPADAGSQRHGRGEDAATVGRVDGEDAGRARERERAREVAGGRGAATAADADQPRLEGRHAEPERRDERATRPRSLDAAAHTARDGRDEGRTQPARQFRGPDAAVSGHVAWGDYEPAIRRWERVLGRPAPAPTEAGPKGGQRLSPRFVEWLMGLDAGWVTDVPGLTRNEQLKALGNGVVPQQALKALRLALPAEVAA